MVGFWFVGMLVFTSNDLPEDLHFKAVDNTQAGAESSSNDAQPLASQPSSAGCCRDQAYVPLLCSVPQTQDAR